MKWAHAVKLWNAHGKVYNPRHVYAIPRKGTPEHADVKHIQEHEELPAHLKKKGPFPAEALAQLKKHAEESAARRDAARPKATPPTLSAEPKATKPKPKKEKLKDASKGTGDIREFILSSRVAPIKKFLESKRATPTEPEAKKPKRDMSKILAGIVAEAKKRKEASSKPDLLKFDAVKELGEDGKEPKKGDSKEKLKSQAQKVNVMKRRVLELLKEANANEDFPKRIKAASHIEKQLYAVEELLDLIKEAGGGKAIFEKKK